MREVKCQDAEKVNVWAGIYKHSIIGPFFIDGNINEENYLDLLETDVYPALLEAAEGDDCIFMQNGAPAHFATPVRAWLDENFPRNMTKFVMFEIGRAHV